MICEKCGATIPDEGGACPLCDWAPGMDEETPVEPETPAGGDGEAVAALLAEDAAPAEKAKTGTESDRESSLQGDQSQPEPKKKRPVGVIVAVVVVVALLAAAVVGLVRYFGSRGQTAADPATVVDEAVEHVLEKAEIDPENELDVCQEIMDFPGSSVMFTVDGTEVTAQEYLYWLGYLTTYYDSMSLYTGVPMDLKEEIEEGVTLDAWLKDNAQDYCVLLALTPAMAQDMGVELTDEDLQKVVDSRAANVADAGGEEAYLYQLQCMGISDSIALRIETLTTLYLKYQEAWVEKTVQELSAEAVSDYAQENDLLRAKHILLLTRDMTTGEVYTEEEIAAQKAKAESLLAQLQADPSKFDQLMQENSEDSGLVAYPDGYVFTAGDMVAEFEDGTRALALGEISGIVESSYGYHIIQRLDPDSEEIRKELALDLFDENVDSWVDNAEVVETELYQSFSTNTYYTSLQAFRDELPEPEIPGDVGVQPAS